MSQNIKYNYTNMSAAKVASFGFKQAELVALGKNLKKINAKLAKKEAEPEISFRKLPYDLISADIIEKIAKNLQGKFDALVVVGIGGSDLGAKALARALVMPNNRLFFIGDTTDPNSLNNLLAKISLKKTLFYVVSKSGETLETLANFIYLRDKVIKAVGLNRHKDHFIITTNEKSGKLLEICKKEGYALLAHYPGGGRFSVLSVNGLLPAAWLGLDIKKLLSGAREMDKMAKNDNWRENLPFIYAALHYLGYKKRKQNIAVLMPYLEALNSFSFWYRQLLAESLGKKYDLKGKLVSIGITPIASAGPKDQHSQLQLYNEGANDKIFTFIRAEKPVVDFKLPLYKNFGLEFLAGKSFDQLLKIEQLAVANSLMKNHRANATLILPEMNEYYLGQLFQFFELATVYLGELLGIDVFNQPGVEDSKNLMIKMLNE
ncbi:MAG: glucose-6-phosphate isomerase [Candidatus Parcubacteria bacterium]|nr:glucose-6-phosphate isomerase [Candidatus Parcubacteria bacterium]